MAEVDQGDVLRIGAIWTFEGTHQVANIWHAQNVAGGDRSYAAASVDVAQYMDDLYDNILANLSNEMVADYITLANVTQATTMGAIAWPVPLTGGGAGDVTAPGVCLFAYSRTFTPRVQIRKYLGVFTEPEMTDGLWGAGVRAAAMAMMAAHVTNYVGAGGMTLLGVAYNRTLQTVTLGVSTSTSGEPAYQRRRRRGRGS